MPKQAPDVLEKVLSKVWEAQLAAEKLFDALAEAHVEIRAEQSARRIDGPKGLTAMPDFTTQEFVAIRDALILLEPCGDDAEEAQAVVDSALAKVEAALDSRGA